jgi:two-component system sensor histidine kinase YesM
MTLMRRVENGDLTVKTKMRRKDEIGMLGDSFDKMVRRIRGLMDQIYQEQQTLRKSELKALQSQINPHFLYNTLDSIIWLARANRTDEIIRMVTSLTKMFRIVISRGKEVISVKEEIDHIFNYLTIQQLRYRSKLSYEIDIPESMYRYQTLKLLLQPLVENAIYHGIKLKKEQGRITVTGYETEHTLHFLVHDTGPGMTEEQLEQLHNTLEEEDGIKMDSYGAKNVHERIRLFFGAEYGLKYESMAEQGTTVTLTIPKLSEVNEHAKSSAG